MNDLKRWMTMLACIAGLWSISGCIRVDYIGQKFPPLPEGKPVAFFDVKNVPPPGEYRVIGHAEVTIPGGYGMVEFREKLIETAREYGASAVRIVKMEKRLVNTYYESSRPSDSPMVASRSDLGAIPKSSGGGDLAVNSFNEVVTVKQNAREVYEHVAKVLFMVTPAEYDQVMNSREKVEK